jgi:hypothetical protein
MARELEAVRLEDLMPGHGDDDEGRAMEARQAQPPSTVNWRRGWRRFLSENSAGFAAFPPFRQNSIRHH